MKRILSLSMIAALSTAALAEDCTTLKFLGTGPGRNLKMSYNGGSSFANVFGGVLRMKLTQDNVASELFGYCGDVKTRMVSGNFCVTPSTTNDLGDRGAKAAHLINKYAFGIMSESNADARNDKAFALQLVVWETLTEESNVFNLGNGSFRAKAAGGGDFTVAQKALIDTYMNDQGASVATYYKSALDNCENPVSQSVITPVPEPATIGVLAAGALALLRRRKANA